MSTTVHGSADLDFEQQAPGRRQSRRRRPRSPGKPKRERLLSLDVFRGLTVAGMLLVNDPGTWGSIYPPLEHAAWNGWTPTDLIFPFFLFIAGVTTHLSLQARRARGDDEPAIRRQIIRRGLLIFLFGFLVNGFPFFTWGTVAGVADPSFLTRVVDRLYHWRIMGVLQRIGLAYLCAALLTQGATRQAAGDANRGAAVRLLVRDDASSGAGHGRPRTVCDREPGTHDGGVVGSAAARLGPLRQSPVGEQQDVGPRRLLLDDSGDRDGDARQPRGAMDREQASARSSGSTGSLPRARSV